MITKMIIILLAFLLNTSALSMQKRKETEPVPQVSSATLELAPTEGVSKRTRQGYQPRSLRELSSSAFNRPIAVALQRGLPQKELTQEISNWKQALINSRLPQVNLVTLSNNLIRDAKITQPDILRLLINQEPTNSIQIQLALINAAAQHNPTLIDKEMLKTAQAISVYNQPLKETMGSDLLERLQEKELANAVKQMGLKLKKYKNTQTNTSHYLISQAPITDTQLENTIEQAQKINDKISVSPDAIKIFLSHKI